ncbi:efflux RND transporter periplasmic adaptor subunit [Bauldia sp.]|uniref:efflux RND transporter periplasmic adaptor subunit n=1 Tax=Bauldia sp. TaxID=2575872 RepID=UPI003BABF430
MSTRAALAVVALLVAGLPATADEALRPVKLMTLEPEANGIEREFFGQVVARQTVDLAFQVGGQIVELPVVEGTRVPEGGLIARLDQETFTLRRDQAKLQLEQAQRTMERQQTLGATRVAQAIIDDAETAAGLAALALRDAENALEDATLTAPFDALIAGRSVANFTTIAAGTPVVRIHDMSEIRVEIDIPEVLFRQAQEEEQVEIYAVFPDSDERYPLSVREFNAEASNVGQTYSITLGMEPPDGMNLLPGASVSVIAKRTGPGERITVPTTAVAIGSDRSTHVLVFEPPGAETGVVRKVPVELAADPKGDFVLAGGVEPGTEIVAAGAARLADGLAVRRFNGF